MSEYFTPGVYLEDIQGSSVVDGVSTSVGALVGVARRGKLGVPVYCTSWSAFLNEYGRGLNTPFMADSYFAYAAWGFFQNGGRMLYCLRVAHTGDTTLTNNAVKATGSFSVGTNVVITAQEEGTWGNSLRVRIVAGNRVPTNFDIIVALGNTDVEKFTNVSNDVKSANYWVDVVNATSKFITAVSGELDITDLTDGDNVTVTYATFTGGNDGVEAITDDDYINALDAFDSIENVNFIAIPGENTNAINNALLSYCEGRGDVFALLDCMETDTIDTLLEKRHAMNTKFGMISDNWVSVADPLSSTGKLRFIPPCGHIMGVFARIITQRGVWKAPAGTEAVLRGVIDTQFTRTTSETDRLNPDGVVCLLPKTNVGICVWGARTLSYEKEGMYIPNVLLDMYIKSSLFQSTQQFVFEPNTEYTWNTVTAFVESFLNTIWLAGGLDGSAVSEAYYVKCDADLNTPDVVASGTLICEVGYKPLGVAEFVVFRFSHNVAE